MKTNMEKVVFTEEEERNFEEYNFSELIYDKVTKIRFTSEKLKDEIKEVFKCKCSECSLVLETKEALIEHVQNVHKKSFW